MKFNLFSSSLIKANLNVWFNSLEFNSNWFLACVEELFNSKAKLEFVIKTNEIEFISENVWYLWDKNSKKRMVHLKEYTVFDVV